MRENEYDRAVVTIEHELKVICNLYQMVSFSMTLSDANQGFIQSHCSLLFWGEYL